MPLTPFHLGPGLVFGYFTLRVFNLWAILWGSVVADLEPLTLIILKKCYLCPHHWFFHSFLGALAGSLILAFILWSFRRKLNSISLKFKNRASTKRRSEGEDEGKPEGVNFIAVRQSFSFLNLFFSSFVAWALLHVLPDSLTHYDVFPFWPSKYNPFLVGPELSLPLIFLFSILGVVGLIIIIRRWR